MQRRKFPAFPCSARGFAVTAHNIRCSPIEQRIADNMLKSLTDIAAPPSKRAKNRPESAKFADIFAVGSEFRPGHPRRRGPDRPHHGSPNTAMKAEGW
jgi:hypothetical protein